MYPAARILQQARGNGAVTWVQAGAPSNLDARDRYRQGRASVVVPALLQELAQAIGLRWP